MIRLTRLNNQPFAVNSDLIKFIENAPDTVITLTTGEKIVVLETPEIVIEKIVVFKRAVLADLLAANLDPNAAVTTLKIRESAAHSHPASESTSLG